jgi:zinc transporter 2
MNIRAAIIHIIGDIIQSIGVVIAALIIYFYPEAHIADPICTLIFAVVCIFTTVPIFRECMSVLMEATPKSIDVLACFEDVLQIEEIEEIHDFHVWSLSAGKLSMSGHIRASDPHKALKKATKVLREKYQIFHTTI